MTVRASRRGVWYLVATGVVLGLAFLVTLWAGGHPGAGVASLVWMLLVTGAMLLVSRRSETVAGIISHTDERITTIDHRAVAGAGLVTLLVILAGAFYEFARGHSGQPYTVLGAIYGVSYVVALAWHRWRR